MRLWECGLKRLLLERMEYGARLDLRDGTEVLLLSFILHLPDPFMYQAGKNYRLLVPLL
jgi:hypothetical protein